MVICKYYRQGNCRYGQYCQFEHINNFGNNKVEYEDEIAVTVAKEVLLAEKGGQWLLSCFGPLKERPCIPGMEDLSPEEVRWEIYHAQKNGIVEQAKLHFQQLCQDMKAKREALKNPTRETVAMLKKILGSSQKAPQLGLANNTSTNNVFANKTYGVQSNNPFGGSGFAFSNNTSSIFGKASSNQPPVFGGTATFGSNLGGFGAPTSSGSIFGGTTNNTSTSFSSVQNSAPAFGTLQNSSIFGTSQGVFGQNNNVFSGTNQLGAASSGSLFNNPMTSQTNNPVFGSTTTTTANLFGGSSSSSGLPTNLFGAPTTTSNAFGNSIFNQPKTQVPAFGGAPVFGGVPSNYASNTSNSIFGNQAFGTPAISTSNIFGATAGTTSSTFGAPASTTTSVFGTPAAVTTPAFGASVATTTPNFGTPAATTTPGFDMNQQSNNNTFGVPVSSSNVFGAQSTTSASFGALPTAISSPFVSTSSQQFDATGNGSAPFGSAGFGMATSTNNTFGTTATSSNSIFANAGTTFATSSANVPNASPFNNVNTPSPFVSSNATPAAAVPTANPFASRALQSNGPFGNVAQAQVGVTSSPFAKSPFNVAATHNIDDSVYSVEGSLTDDEKSMYLAEKFIIGKIPLKPPTKDIR